MITRKYKIADKTVEVNSIYNEVHEYCSDYLTDEPTDYSVTTTQADIDFEREKSTREDETEGIPIRQFSDGYLEELAVYRKIAEKMLDFDTILFHGSVVAVNGVGYLFTAKSGTGKSTHTRLWREYFGDRAVMVNDDKPLLNISESGVIAYGTPYNGKHRLGANISVPLKAICILTRAAENHIEPITRDQAYTMLLQQVYRPSDNVGSSIFNRSANKDDSDTLSLLEFTSNTSRVPPHNLYIKAPPLFVTCVTVDMLPMLPENSNIGYFSSILYHIRFSSATRTVSIIYEYILNYHTFDS